MAIEYTIKRSSRRKKLTITVERDRSVVVHAPIEATDEKIQDIVTAKTQWIKEKVSHVQKYSKTPHPPGKELVNGESALFLGREYKLSIIDTDIDEVRFDNQVFIVPSSFLGKRKQILRQWYFDQAEQIILPKIYQTANMIGVTVASASINNIQYRWGSCTPKDKIRINWRLIKAPMFAINYIVVHELAHLLEFNHTPRFWNIVQTHSTQMEKAKRWLLDHGQLLEEDI
jgi:predicted metal-dependent hydrolase